jgi:hypothetical protein
MENWKFGAGWFREASLVSGVSATPVLPCRGPFRRRRKVANHRVQKRRCLARHVRVASRELGCGRRKDGEEWEQGVDEPGAAERGWGETGKVMML